MLNNYQIGILWSISTSRSNMITVRHKYRYFLEQIEPEFPCKIYCKQESFGLQYVLKVTSRALIDELDSLGYTRRNSEIRTIPILADRDFLKAYLELHSNTDFKKYKRKNGDVYRARIRVYGNQGLIEGVNVLLHNITGMELKKPQRMTDKTYYLSICGLGEIQDIYDKYKNDTVKFEPYWDRMKEHLEHS